MQPNEGVLSCYVLVPFTPSFSFVYEYGIKAGLKETFGEDAVAVTRADENLARKGDFCNYTAQLSSGECGFDTITNLKFWNEITEHGSNWSYLKSNVHAAENGAEVRRVFVIDLSQHPKGAEDDHIDPILRHIVSATGGVSARMQLRVLCTDTPTMFTNFGLLRKRSERLLFVPDYNAEGSMTRTMFWYADADHPDRSGTPKNRETIDARRSEFQRAWDHPKALSLVPA